MFLAAPLVKRMKAIQGQTFNYSAAGDTKLRLIKSPPGTLMNLEGSSIRWSPGNELLDGDVVLFLLEEESHQDLHQLPPSCRHLSTSAVELFVTVTKCHCENGGMCDTDVGGQVRCRCHEFFTGA